jgi:hypothetical protein
MKQIKDEIKYYKASDIKPYDGAHNIESTIEFLKESIRMFGIQQPIQVDRNLVIVAGNAVYKAAVELGIADIPCVVLDDLTDDEIAQYRIADNKTSEFAKWNEKKLKQELSYLDSPNDLQFCFDESIMRLIGVQEQKPVSPAVSVPPKAPSNVSDIKNADVRASVEQAQKEAQKLQREQENFKTKLQNVDKSLEAKPREYFEYFCGKCGRKVIVKQ